MLHLPRTHRTAVLIAAVAVPAAAASLLVAGAASANGNRSVAHAPQLIRHDVRVPGYVTPQRHFQPVPVTRPDAPKPVTTSATATPPASSPVVTHTASPTPPAPAPTTTQITTTVRPPAPTTTTHAATSSAPAGIVDEPAFANAVLSQLNSERAAHGLKPLVSDSRLICSAYHHNLAMSQADTMSHQLPNEPDVGARESACGYSWSRWAENIGWNGDMTSSGAQALETAMYNEVAPNDGHRQNILSPALVNIGISVILDNTHHKLWLTEDFGTP